MTEISQPPPISGQSTSPAPATSASAAAFSGEEFDTFLQLLTAQIQNQDPLAPLDSTQFVEQLATFSSLEQQVRSNVSLDGIASMIADLHGVVASDWLGSRVAVDSSWVPYAGEAIEYSFDSPAEADTATLSVRSSNGVELWTETLDPGQSSHVWDGRTIDGAALAQDTLVELRIDLYRGSERLGSAQPRIVTTVTDVANEGGALRLGTKSNLSADIRDVRRLEE